MKTTLILLALVLASTTVRAYDTDRDHLNMGAIYAARHLPSKKDRQFYDWAVNQQRLGKLTHDEIKLINDRVERQTGYGPQ